MDEICWCGFWFRVADPDSGFGPGAGIGSALGIPAHNMLNLKGKLQSTDPSAFLELWAQSAAWWLKNCHMHCANIPGNVGHGSVDLSWGFWLPVAEPLSSPAEKPPCATILTFPRLPWSLEQGGNDLLPFCHHLEAGMWLRKRKGRMDYSFLSPALPSGRRQRDKHEIIVEIKTNTQNIWHWVKCFSWALDCALPYYFVWGKSALYGKVLPNLFCINVTVKLLWCIAACSRKWVISIQMSYFYAENMLNSYPTS